MEYNKIVSVTGMPGLFELLSSKADGAVVRSLDDNTSKFVSTRLHNFSHLESIEVYTTRNNDNLSSVFLAMKGSEEPIPSAKAEAKALKSYFEKVFPDLDFERVYTSDMKKMVKWFEIIQKNEIEIKEYNEEEKEALSEKKNAKPIQSAAHVKDLKPQVSNPKKIESRGVK